MASVVDNKEKNRQTLSASSVSNRSSSSKMIRGASSTEKDESRATLLKEHTPASTITSVHSARASIVDNKENNRQNLSAGSAANRSSSSKTIRGASATKKEGKTNRGASLKDDDTPAVSLRTNRRLSPYHRRMRDFQRARNDSGDSSVCIILSDDNVMLDRSGIIESLFERKERAQDLKTEEHQRALKHLTEAQVNQGLHCIITSSTAVKLQNKFWYDVFHAGDNNTLFRGHPAGFVMCDTSSSHPMCQIISRQLRCARKVLHKASTQILGVGEIPGIAKQTLEVTFAAIYTAHRVIHWRNDTEEPEKVNNLAQRLAKLARELLWFTDAELGFLDPYSRPGLLYFLEDMAEDWISNGSDMGYDLDPMTFKTVKNGNGLGRPLAADANPSPTKRAKKSTLSPAAAVVALGMVASLAARALSLTNQADTERPKRPPPAAAPVVPAVAAPSYAEAPSLTSYLSGIDHKLSLRVKTVVQLRITDLQDPQKDVEYVVVSGATDMKKMNQLLAYLTWSNPVYKYHSQRGTSLEYSHFQLAVPGFKTCWFTNESMGKKITALRETVEAVLDKPFKIVQIFQGLNCSANGGITFDSPFAQKIAQIPRALIYVTPDNRRFAIHVQAIVPSKVQIIKKVLMPRIVTYYDDGQHRSGFGFSFQNAKQMIQGDRNDAKFVAENHFTKKDRDKIHLKSWITPICDPEGCNIWNCRWDDVGVLSAGPPDCMLRR